MPKLLDTAAKAQIAAAITKAESRCQGEIVFSEAARSEDYGRWFALPVLVLTVGVALVGHLLWPQLATPWLLVAQVPVAIIMWLLLSRPRLALLLIPDSVEVEAVRNKALQLFSEHALFETPHRAGVLIHVSAFERRVEILADRGLDGIIDQAAWQQHVAHIVAAIHAGKTADGVCEVVDQISKRLAQQWGPPKQAGNDLPNMV